MTIVPMTKEMDELFDRYILGKVTSDEKATVERLLHENQTFSNPETGEEFTATNHLAVCEENLLADAILGNLNESDVDAFIAYMNARYPDRGVTRETLSQSLGRGTRRA